MHANIITVFIGGQTAEKHGARGDRNSRMVASRHLYSFVPPRNPRWRIFCRSVVKYFSRRNMRVTILDIRKVFYCRSPDGWAQAGPQAARLVDEAQCGEFHCYQSLDFQRYEVVNGAPTALYMRNSRDHYGVTGLSRRRRLPLVMHWLSLGRSFD